MGNPFFLYWEDYLISSLKRLWAIVLEGWIRWFKDSDIPGHCRVSAMRDYQELIYLCRMSPRRGFGDSKEGSPAFGFLRAVNRSESSHEPFSHLTADYIQHLGKIKRKRHREPKILHT